MRTTSTPRRVRPTSGRRSRTSPRSRVDATSQLDSAKTSSSRAAARWDSFAAMGSRLQRPRQGAGGLKFTIAPGPLLFRVLPGPGGPLDALPAGPYDSHADSARELGEQPGWEGGNRAADRHNLTWVMPA